MKVHIIVDEASNWIPKQMFLTFGRHSSMRPVDNPGQADLIWIMSYYVDLGSIARLPEMSKLRKRLGLAYPPRLLRRPEMADKPILASVHHLVPGKEAQFVPYLERIAHLSDYFHIFCKRNAPFCANYISQPMFFLPYWIDLKVFVPMSGDARAQLRSQYGLPADRIVVGSFQRDTEANGVSPKLEKGPDVLCDILERLDPNRYFVLLSGPRRDYVERRLSKMGMPFKSLGFVPASDMPGIYNAIDLYLVTSRVEGGPQAILECMATKTPVLSTDVGIADCLPEQLIMRDAGDFLKVLGESYPDLLAENLRRVQYFEAGRVVSLYESSLAKLIEGHRANPKRAHNIAVDLEWVANT